MPYKYSRIEVPDFLVDKVRALIREAEGAYPLPAVQRFWAFVDRSGECWLWRGAFDSQGYGAMSFRGKRCKAHRLAYELTHGPIPHGMGVLHNCPGGDNPRCVNPAHLFLGTQAENMRDMARKGRAARGEKQSKLTTAQVMEIRRAYACGGVSLRRLGRQYGVADSTIHRIVRREHWRHI